MLLSQISLKDFIEKKLADKEQQQKTEPNLIELFIRNDAFLLLVEKNDQLFERIEKVFLSHQSTQSNSDLDKQIKLLNEKKQFGNVVESNSITQALKACVHLKDHRRG